MEFSTIQDTIAERIGKLKSECAAIETALGGEDLDFDSPMAQQLHNRQVRFQDNLNFLESLAFFLISQENELDVLRLKVESDARLIGYLRQSNAQKTISCNAANAVTNLLQMERARWNNIIIEDLEKVFDPEELNIIIPQLRKIAA